MPTTISDAFELPRPEDIRAMGFVVKLREAAPDSAETKQLVGDYVVTPAVQKELPAILDAMKQVFDRGEEYGRFIHGSFGSGKSHFMTMLSLLIEGAPAAYDKFRPVLAAHRDVQKSKGHDLGDPELWLAKANLLVVRIHMLSVRGRGTGLDRAIYDGFNDALKRRGKATFEFLNVQAIFDEVRREAAEYGDLMWKRLETGGILGGRTDFEALEAGGIKGRETFARAWLEYKGRSAADAGVDPRWSEGLRRMAEHAKTQGFGGIVLMIDEFLLWLAEKSGQEFVEEINNLNVIVDHNTGQRPLPIFVFVARQRNLQDFFPDLVDESKIHEHIEHHSKRFEETRLQDVELRHIVSGRVLAHHKQPDAIKKAVGALVQTHEKILPALLAGGDIDYLRDVYPFHPALIEMLVDVSSLMQRERSALRLLYELLVLHNPDLALGEFIPVGSAFAAIFPESGVEASKKRETMEDIHHQYYVRLVPAMRKVAEDVGPEFTEERKHALHQLIRTVLLAEVSPRLKQAGLTVERLVQLNSVDVEGETFRGQVRIAETDLLALQQKIPDLQIAGQGKTALVKYVLGRVSLSEYLARARSKCDNINKRFETFWPALKRSLGIDGDKGFEEGSKAGDWPILWRKTKRTGAIRLGNVREMSNEDFMPPVSGFKILVDYPWDEPGHTVDEDRHRAASVRKKFGSRHTVCWLPRHMSPTELGTITELAAVRYLRSKPGQEDLLAGVSPTDRSALLDLAETREGTLEGQLGDLIRRVYVDHGEFAALLPDFDGRRPHESLEDNLEHVAGLLMDRQFPLHPVLLAEPRRADLDLLLKWMLAAGETSTSVAYDEGTGKVLKTLGQPLELVNLGQSKASLRLDSRYIKDVMTRVDQDSVKWNPIADHLREHFGFTSDVVDLFLCFLCQRDHRALGELDRQPIQNVRIGMPVTEQIRLERGKLVTAAEWHALRDLGHELLGEARPPAHRSLQAQDRLAVALRTHAQKRRATLEALHQRLVGLDAPHGARLAQISAANAALAPLVQAGTDSHKILTEFLAAWPSDDATLPLRHVVGAADTALSAVGELDVHRLETLQRGVMHTAVGSDVQAHLAALNARLGTSDSEQELGKAWIDIWNEKARTLVHRLVEQSVSVPATPTTSTAQPQPPNASLAFPNDAPAVLLRLEVDPSKPDAVNRFVAKVREVVREQSGTVHLALVREEKPE